jgi:phosphoribosylaminoimidazole-succinocarboxamide synthase
MKTTQNMLDILSRHGIKHVYYYIGEKFILSEKLDITKDIPPIEVIVKKCFVGSDKYRYYNLEQLKNRFGKHVVSKDKNEYQKRLVRFDYRNPNFHPETGKPIGDMLLCEDLADEFINVENAKTTALIVFNTLDMHFAKMNIYLEDICLMLVVNGDKLYGEISQDCGRYKYIKENELSDLDKDVWRAGGSSELVLEKYQRLSKLINEYVLSLYELDKEEFS